MKNGTVINGSVLKVMYTEMCEDAIAVVTRVTSLFHGHFSSLALLDYCLQTHHL